MRIRLAAAIGLAATAVLLRPGGAVAAGDPACGTIAVVQRAGSVLYGLPHPFVRAGTDSLWTALRGWIRGEDYTLDRARGVLRLLREPAPGETLWVSSCWLLEPPPLEFQVNAFRPARAAADSSSAGSDLALPQRPITARIPSEAPTGTSLSLTGNKTLAVDFGSNQDAFLRQSLDLAVSGTLAPGVELTGALSDRNTPLTAAGSTQDLQSLDRLLLELHAPQGGAALGDVGLSLDRGEFGRLERRVQGMRGEWSMGGFRSLVAAASARGEYFSIQFLGAEGRQGPYQLTDRGGGAGISVVAGSEIVTVDGERLTRGESADYAMDYERGRLTFSNRRPITSASRITVEYQYTVNRFRRNLALAGGSWERGAFSGFTTFLTESDDRGRPLDLSFDASDRLVLGAAGDSAGRALGSGVTTGGGEYDLVVRDSTTAYYAFAGPDSGAYALRFVPVGPGTGDYADSAVVAGRTTYRWVGPGNGAWRVGRSLPLPDTHQLWSLGGALHRGPLVLGLEGAMSRLDLNTFSALDDADNAGHAGSARLRLEGASPAWLGGRAGLEMQARSVGRRFRPFGRLERAFAQEDWGLPIGADLDHQARIELVGFVRPRLGGELRASAGQLETPDGFRSFRRVADWMRDGTLLTRAHWERSDGLEKARAFARGGRERRIAELSLRTKWLEPALRGEWDERRAPSDTGRAGERSREWGAELRSPRLLAWRALAGWTLRRDARLSGEGFADHSEARTLRLAVESPASLVVGGALTWQQRDLRPLVTPASASAPLHTRSDLASARLRAADPGRGLAGLFNLEVTSEGESERTRVLTFVGSGRGAYDSLGNFVGTGDYELVLTVSPDFRLVARAASSARASWQFGASEAWRGSRVEFNFETDARRRGALRATDPALSPGAALRDPALSRGAVTQRLEAEIAPGSAAAALRLRIERRVNADRSFENFSQLLDEKNASARWRARPAAAWSSELEARWKRQQAEQALGSASGYRRVLIESGGQGQIAFTPGAGLRAAGVLEGIWSRPEAPAGGGPYEFTRTLRVGPDLGVAVGPRGRLEVSGRRSFVSGPPALSLLPSADLAGAPRWEGTVRIDYRVRESTTFGTSFLLRDRPGRPTEYNGRAELRAFF